MFRTSTFSWVDVTAEIGTRALTFSSQMSRSNFEGLAEEYPNLYVSSGGSGLEAGRTAGRVFNQYRGEKVVAIHIVRESITRTVDGEEQWEFGTDFAVVFEFSAGAVCISKSRTAPLNGLGTTSPVRVTKFTASGFALTT